MKLSPTNLPKKLRAAREARNLTQADVAQRARLTPAHISHFECHVKDKGRAPSLANFCILANALGASADELLS